MRDVIEICMTRALLVADQEMLSDQYEALVSYCMTSVFSRKTTAEQISATFEHALKHSGKVSARSLHAGWDAVSYVMPRQIRLAPLPTNPPDDTFWSDILKRCGYDNRIS